jgi:chaperonin cofactor prefoldin
MEEAALPGHTHSAQIRSKAIGSEKPQVLDISRNYLLPQFDGLRTKVAEVDKVVQELTKLGGGSPLSKLVATLQVGSSNPTQVQRLKKQVDSLTLEVGKLRSKGEEIERKCREAKRRANALARTLMQVQEVIGTPGDVFFKAKLWDDKVSQDPCLSKTRIAEFITTYITKVDKALEDMRTIVGGISFALGAHGVGLRGVASGKRWEFNC